ncbi:MAG TPA: Gldg family protein, partial [Deferrisomatales bacterium]|nr:Gldg family protein [Deferrisomatales bacterium]
ISAPGQFGGEELYLGLVAVNELGSEQVLPFLSPQREEFLEYDITRAIAGVRQGVRKVIGVLSPLDVTGEDANPMAAMSGMPQGQPWALVSELRQQYDVRNVAVDASEIDPALDLLLVIHPRDLGDATRYALDQYLLAGGRLAVFVDPLNLYEQQNFPSADFQARFQARFDSDLPDLLKAWGVELVPGKIAADLDLGTQVRAGQRVILHPAFITLGPEQCNQDEIASAGLESLLVAHAGILREVEDKTPEGLTHTVLLHTGPRAGTVDAMQLKFGTDPDQLRRDVKPGDAPLTLAMKISGSFTSAFPNGAPAGKEGDAQAAPAKSHLAQSAKDSTVLVVADADLLTDDFSVRRQNLLGQTLLMMLNDNLAFAGNSAEVLAGGQALASLRTRGKSARPFTLVDQLEREADEKWRGVEADLLAKQQETSRRLQALEQGKDEQNRALLSPSQVEEIQNFREELVANKKKLREVRRNLRQDIENLGWRLKLLNIALVPALVLLAGFGPLLWRQLRSGSRA